MTRTATAILVPVHLRSVWPRRQARTSTAGGNAHEETAERSPNQARGIIPSDFIGNDKLSAAVSTIAANCGPGARRLLLSNHVKLTNKTVRYLAGTSPEYQRLVVDRLRHGEADPLKHTALSVLVYDTVSFKEVLSRLDRALGDLRSEERYLLSVRDNDSDSISARHRGARRSGRRVPGGRTEEPQ